MTSNERKSVDPNLIRYFYRMDPAISVDHLRKKTGNLLGSFGKQHHLGGLKHDVEVQNG